MEMCLSVKRTGHYSVLLCAPVLCDAASEVGVTGGTPVLYVFFLFSAEKTDFHETPLSTIFHIIICR